MEQSQQPPQADGPADIGALDNSLQLDKRQQRLREALNALDCRLANAYIGAHLVLRQRNNPLRMAQAGYAVRAEFAAFGWWFASGVFDARWSLHQLRNVLETGKKLGHSIGVFKRLAVLATDNAREVADCLGLLIRSGTTHDDLFINQTEISSSLDQLLGSQDPSVVDRAEDMINHMLAIGQLPYIDLLARREDKHDVPPVE